MCDSSIREFVESIKKRDLRTRDKNRAQAIFPSDLKAAFEYLDSEAGMSEYTETERLFFKGFSTTAFRLMGRYVSTFFDFNKYSSLCVSHHGNDG